MYTEDEYLMLSGIQHFVFCRRQWALIHVEQQWAENYKTTAGELMHKRAHDDTSFERRGDLLITRGLRISSGKLGVSGQCDVVEFHQVDHGITVYGYEGTWDIVPVEYKNGSPKENREDEVQLCAQAICLEEMFQTEITEGFLYYGQKRRRTKVLFDEELRRLVEDSCEEMHQLFQRGYTPKVKPTPKCRSCSLTDLCLPRMQKVPAVKSYINSRLTEMLDDLKGE